jgi:DNA-binding transcriptional MerR regulator
MSHKNGIAVETAADMLGISKSLIRFWEEEFELPKRLNGSLSPLEMAQLCLIHALIIEKEMSLEDAKEAFGIENKFLTDKYEMIEKLKNIRQALLELRDKI